MTESAAPTTDTRLQHVGEAVLVLAGSYLIAGIVVAVTDPLTAAVVGSAADSNMAKIARTIIQYGTVIGVVAFYLRAIDTDRLVRLAVPSRRTIGLIVGGTVVLLGSQYAINQLLQLANVAPGANQAVLTGVGHPLYTFAVIDSVDEVARAVAPHLSGRTGSGTSSSSSPTSTASRGRSRSRPTTSCARGRRGSHSPSPSSRVRP